jgi:hypothetical protein
LNPKHSTFLSTFLGSLGENKISTRYNMDKNEKLKISQKKYYEKNKSHLNEGRLKRTYVKDFGQEYVDKLYVKYNGDTTQIKPIIKIRRAYMKAVHIATEFKGVDEHFL